MAIIGVTVNALPSQNQKTTPESKFELMPTVQPVHMPSLRQGPGKGRGEAACPD